MQFNITDKNNYIYHITYLNMQYLTVNAMCNVVWLCNLFLCKWQQLLFVEFTAAVLYEQKICQNASC